MKLLTFVFVLVLHNISDAQIEYFYLEDSVIEIQMDVISTCGCMCEPKFPGGDALMRDFLQTNLTYPLEALKKGESGTVWVDFIVEKDGSIKNIQAIRGVSYSLDQEAMRVVKTMPPWDSGYNPTTKKAIKIRVRIPVCFEYK